MHRWGLFTNGCFFPHNSFNLTDKTASFDGAHYGKGVNDEKAQILLNYIMELRKSKHIQETVWHIPVVIYVVPLNVYMYIYFICYEICYENKIIKSRNGVMELFLPFGFL